MRNGELGIKKEFGNGSIFFLVSVKWAVDEVLVRIELFMGFSNFGDGTFCGFIRDCLGFLNSLIY